MDDNHKYATTVESSLEILETLRENNGARIIDLSEELDLAQSTIYRHLQTLEKKEFVYKDSNIYHPGLKFLQFSEYSTQQIEGYSLIKDKVDQIADETDERAQFVVEEHGWAVYVYQSIGDNAVISDFNTGHRYWLHATAAGKSILAHISDEKISDIIEARGLKKVSENTISNKNELFESLEEIRSQGYSINDEESIKNNKAIGVPVYNSDDQVFGALSVAAPIHRMKNEWVKNELLNLLQNIAREIELYLKYG
jgi:DNA-binding IclR family transcriptional regulator